MQSRETILLDVSIERDRQEMLKRADKFKWSCSHSGMTDTERLVVLGEEFGEVAKEVCEAMYQNPIDSRLRKLRIELVQVAAVCVAWCEAIDKELESRGH